jgi:hypothetical protein
VSHLIDISGQRFGSLVAVGRGPRHPQPSGNVARSVGGSMRPGPLTASRDPICWANILARTTGTAAPTADPATSPETPLSAPSMAAPQTVAGGSAGFANGRIG